MYLYAKSVLFPCLYLFPHLQKCLILCIGRSEGRSADEGEAFRKHADEKEQVKNKIQQAFNRWQPDRTLQDQHPPTYTTDFDVL